MSLLENRKKGVFVQFSYGEQGLKTDKLQKKLLRFEDIHYIISAEKDNNICFGTEKNNILEEYYLRKTLKFIEAQLPNNFLRINQSFIINLDKIEGRKNEKIICMKFKEFSIGTKYEKKVKEVLENNFIR